MITIEQIKAARALLKWGQADLAHAASVSLPALGNLERGAVTPRLKTLEAIRVALEAAGIEFIEGPGVRCQREALHIEMLEGKDVIKRLFEDIFHTLQEKGGELLVRGVSESRFMREARAPLISYLQKVHRHKRIKNRILVCEGDRRFVGKRESSVYRWVEKEIFGVVPCYIYWDKYAVLLWGSPLRAVITQNPSLAETYRRQFEADWRRAIIPPKDIGYDWDEKQ